MHSEPSSWPEMNNINCCRPTYINTSACNSRGKCLEPNACSTANFSASERAFPFNDADGIGTDEDDDAMAQRTRPAVAKWPVHTGRQQRRTLRQFTEERKV